MAPSEAKQGSGKVAAALSGSLSGAIVSVCVQPLDVVRTRMQADAIKNALGGTFKTFQTIIREGGVRSLWNGTGPTIWRLSVGLGLQMSVLEGLKEGFARMHMRSHVGRGDAGPLVGAPQRLTKAEAFLAGGLARGVAAAATCPVTVVKTRMEYAGGTAVYKGTMHALASIMRNEGMAGLFRGLGPTIVTNAPYSAFYYLFYTSLQQRMQQNGFAKTSANFASGTVAAICATLLTQPTDMLRTHMQLGLGGGKTGLGIRQTWAAVTGGSLGYRALLVGALPRVMKRTLQTALVWTIYEELQPAMKAAFQGSATQGPSQGATTP